MPRIHQGDTSSLNQELDIILAGLLVDDDDGEEESMPRFDLERGGDATAALRRYLALKFLVMMVG